MALDFNTETMFYLTNFTKFRFDPKTPSRFIDNTDRQR